MFLLFTLAPIYLGLGFLNLIWIFFKFGLPSTGQVHAANNNFFWYLFDGVILWPLNFGKYPVRGAYGTSTGTVAWT